MWDDRSVAIWGSYGAAVLAMIVALIGARWLLIITDAATGATWALGMRNRSELPILRRHRRRHHPPPVLRGGLLMLRCDGERAVHDAAPSGENFAMRALWPVRNAAERAPRARHTARAVHHEGGLSEAQRQATHHRPSSGPS